MAMQKNIDKRKNLQDFTCMNWAIEHNAEWERKFVFIRNGGLNESFGSI